MAGITIVNFPRGPGHELEAGVFPLEGLPHRLVHTAVVAVAVDCASIR